MPHFFCPLTPSFLASEFKTKMVSSIVANNISFDTTASAGGIQDEAKPF